MIFEMNRRAMLAGLSAVVLTACNTPPPSPQFPELIFTHLAPIRLDVGALEIVDRYSNTSQAIDVAQGMPVPPVVAARQWARDRLVPSGKGGVVVFTITDGSVLETPLTLTKGVRGVVTNDQSERYDGRLAAKIEIRDGTGQRTGEVSAEATRSRTVPENLSLNERDKVWFEITESLIVDLDRELERAIAQFLSPFVIR